MTAGFLALALVLAAGVVWFRAALRVNLPRNRSAYVIAMVAALALAIIALLGDANLGGTIAAGLAAVLSAFFLFTVSISAQKTAADAIAVGDTIPAFTAIDENGEAFDSAVLANNTVLIKFFRGHW